MSLPKPFPYYEPLNDYNPGIRLFGKRFISEQTVLEFAAEFLNVIFSEKWIDGSSVSGLLPSMQQVEEWPASASLEYKPRIKLNLKLFSFLSGSRVDGRHDVHKEQYKRLVGNLKDKVHSNSEHSTLEAIAYLESLLRAFQGAGSNRAWCAQPFYPLTSSFLTQETIWNETVAAHNKPASWDESIQLFNKYYSVSKHRFMARGGELLYLQLCNLFRQSNTDIRKLAEKLNFENYEADLVLLHDSLNTGFSKLNGVYTRPLDNLADFIDALDPATRRSTNREEKRLECEWVPDESWPEGYVFAVELSRLLNATLDPVERLELFITGCSLQVLRSICAQSIRYVDMNKSDNALGYSWIFSSPDSSAQQRRVSSRNLQVVQGMIHQSLRYPDLIANAEKDPLNRVSALYKEADNRYGHKLLLSLGKKLSIIVPYTGPGARFVMTDSLLRYLVVALLRPGERVTYQTFINRMYLHYGIAVEGEELNDALRWSDMLENHAIQPVKGSWLQSMLRASGFLTDLSDAWSIVKNPFGVERMANGRNQE